MISEDSYIRIFSLPCFSGFHKFWTERTFSADLNMVRKLYVQMKSLPTSTIGEDSLSRCLFGVYRQQALPMLKFSIYANKGDLFKQLAIQALQISIQSTKQKKIRNLPGYFSGVFRKLIDKALFRDAFKDYDTPVNGLYFEEV